MNRLPGKHIPFFQTRRINPAWALSLCFLLSYLTLSGQNMVIEADQKPLNLVLIQLAKAYEVQLSFDDELLSRYQVTANQSFGSPEEAISYLLKDLPLDYQKSGEVFVIFKKQTLPEVRTYRLFGQLLDAHSGEALPYTHLLIQNKGIVSDFTGKFSYLTHTDTPLEVSASYLGYYILDTILSPGERHILTLKPSIIGLREVVIEGSMIERSGQAGEEAGMIRLNHKVAHRLPGNGDNSVFNFLRLQPGILAAGEQSSEMIIWGSYSGHSQLIFDGITIFGLKNFNDNISFVNPYMAKDIKVMKGGYGAEYGDRVGGIVEISGVSGSTQKPSINLNINNMTVNGMASVPLTRKSSLTFAYRHTYYNFYDAGDFSIIGRGRPTSSQTDISVYPDYLFRDFNLKYGGSTRSGDMYHISIYEGKDNFSYSIDQERNRTQISQDTDENNRQRGAALFFGKSWRGGNISNFSLSYSGLEREQSEALEMIRGISGSIVTNEELFYRNQIQEAAFTNKNHFSLTPSHKLETGWSYIYDKLAMREDSFEVNIRDSRQEAHRLNFYIQDRITPNEVLSVTPGIRIDYPMNLKRVFIQPRIKATLSLGDHIRLNGAWGIYKQFISETSMIDDLGNYRYFWALCDNEEVPVLHAQHLVGGISYRREGFTIGLETFYKTTEGITRYINMWREGFEAVFQGQAKVYGMDLLVKKYFGAHEAWASYSLSKTEEYFPYFPSEAYEEAPQDQRHEIKGALLINLKPFFLSANYVYGSGFPDRPSFFHEETDRYPYSRLDAAFIYRHSVKSYHFEAGISILNILNTENIKQSNLIRIPGTQTGSISIHAEAVPFTPTLYLNISF
ncbi:MAG: TonB-dependent receptor plug domain-containing protein [Bacteroidota bacterium]